MGKHPQSPALPKRLSGVSMLPTETQTEHRSPLTEVNLAALAKDDLNTVAERMDTVRWLIGVMMIGQAFELRASALEIYQSVVTLTDDIDSLHMCLAFSTALNGDGNYARELSVEGFDDCPNADHLNMAMAYTLKMIGDSAWRGFADKVRVGSSNEQLRKSAQLMCNPNLNT
jgi:hypothetical protein